MNLIFISNEIPYPANTGGRIVVYKRIQYLAKNNDIYFFCVTDDVKDEESRAHLESLCKEVHLYNRHTLAHRMATAFRLWQGPYACVSRIFTDMQKDINYCFARNKIDFVLVQFPQLLGNIDQYLFDSGKVILEQHNIEYVTMKNLAYSIKSPIRKSIFLIESKRLKTWEEHYYKKKIALYTFVSSEDKAFFDTKFLGHNTYHNPIGAELRPLPKEKRDTHNIMYFGKMAYPANAEAAEWFAEQVFPKIQKEITDAKFYVVGKDPIPYLYELPKNNTQVVVTGTVDSVEEYYKKADIVIVPLSHGGGVKVKVLEALGYGKIVVTTDKGIEGTDFKSGSELICANTAEEMSQSIISVLQHLEQYEDIRQQGMKSIEEKYTWKAVISKFEDYLHTNFKD